MDRTRVPLMPMGYRGEAASKYDECRFGTRQGQLFSDLESEQVQRAVRDLAPGSRVLEIGCGTGRFSESLGRQGFVVVATDPSSDMLELAARRCAGLNAVTFGQEEGGRLSYDDSAYDFVFAIRVTNQTESEEYAIRMIREMIRVTRSGGRILVEFVNRRRPFRRDTQSVRLAFAQIGRVAEEQGGEVLWRAGVLVFSQSVLDRVPDRWVSWWGRAERRVGPLLWRWASRGYVLLRKR